MPTADPVTRGNDRSSSGLTAQGGLGGPRSRCGAPSGLHPTSFRGCWDPPFWPDGPFSIFQVAVPASWVIPPRPCPRGGSPRAPRRPCTEPGALGALALRPSPFRGGCTWSGARPGSHAPTQDPRAACCPRRRLLSPPPGPLRGQRRSCGVGDRWRRRLGWGAGLRERKRVSSGVPSPHAASFSSPRTRLVGGRRPECRVGSRRGRTRAGPSRGQPGYSWGGPPTSSREAGRCFQKEASWGAGRAEAAAPVWASCLQRVFRSGFPFTKYRNSPRGETWNPEHVAVPRVRLSLGTERRACL